jgi:hypothetical protein
VKLGLEAGAWQYFVAIHAALGETFSEEKN